MKVFFFAQELIKLCRFRHVVDDFVLDWELRPLIRLVVIEGTLDLLRSGSKGIDGQQVMGDVIMEAAAVEINVELVVVLLEQLASNLG